MDCSKRALEFPELGGDGGGPEVGFGLFEERRLIVPGVSATSGR
jgi:hypothetical protein